MLHGKCSTEVILYSCLISLEKTNIKVMMSPKEDVLYATIDHGTDHTAGHGTNTDRRDSMDNDCHYAVVMLPSEPVKKLDNNEDCADDYVLMT
ncbi:uncharacterized protein si:ch211-214p13.7 isoform X2 [Ictalurus punctatus]|uniref:Uncharacterized protein si:ch211-214p13.7 isoform X2 n=1 Tax=Ictalurus punctatus TaxID=7998 RepID=A0A9F7RHL4_ICTPU|nr:uncharacterized protein si:ch211-214p13.7 isoform X2 [Ictalurus punctatus]